MTQEQANWEWIDARVKKLEEHCFSAKTLTEKQIEAIKTLYYNRGHEDGRNIALPAKTLTDEEILDICIVGGFYDRIDDPFFDKKTGAWSLDEDLIEFARAILRKASEK
jgi:hypothetical protein